MFRNNRIKNQEKRKKMTDIELKKARIDYKMQLEGQKQLSECLANSSVKTFVSQFFSDTNEESIKNVSKDEILRRSFLKTFQNTEESSHLMVWINYIQKTNANLSDGQPVLESINWKRRKVTELIEMNGEKLLKTPNGLNIYNLYCDLETNIPYLISEEHKKEFFKKANSIFVPFKPVTETYQYNSSSLERITKGSAEKSFNRLQLYYFRLLLDNSKSKEEAITRIKSLTTKQMTDICLDDESRI